MLVWTGLEMVELCSQEGTSPSLNVGGGGGGGGCQRNFGCSCQQYDSERENTKCFDRPVVLHFKFTFYYLL